MFRTLDASMLNLPYSLDILAPLAAANGMQAVSAPAALTDDLPALLEADKKIRDLGLTWGLMPMTGDFYYWDLTDEKFDEALERLKVRAANAEKAGITHAYNHVWSSSFRPFDENFDWHVRRIAAVSNVLADHGIRYGLEFIGPFEVRRMQPHEFVHSLSGVLALADAAGGKAGIAFDTFHWYCSNNGDWGDLMWMAEHTGRLVAVHLNDAVPGVPYNEQKDLQRRLPLESGVIDTRRILKVFQSRPNDALYMIEPFEPGRTRFHGLAAEEAVREAAGIFARLEA